MESFDTYEVLHSLQQYFQQELPSRILEHADIGLKDIQEWDIGYRDIVSGLHNHPAFLIKSDKDRESSDGPAFQTMEVDIALVFTCEDQDIGYQRLCRYQSILDALLRDNPHFGGNIAEARSAVFSKARDATRNGLFFLFVDMEVDVDVIAWRA
ncbi:MAG: hypothetical protein VB025_09190 [Sphaerochaeta sp.]|nr:hypothetical protein [Sphaerochaeta sp.]